jgi:hypothetical protein
MRIGFAAGSGSVRLGNKARASLIYTAECGSMPGCLPQWQGIERDGDSGSNSRAGIDDVE